MTALPRRRKCGPPYYDPKGDSPGGRNISSAQRRNSRYRFLLRWLEYIFPPPHPSQKEAPRGISYDQNIGPDTCVSPHSVYFRIHSSGWHLQPEVERKKTGHTDTMESAHLAETKSKYDFHASPRTVSASRSPWLADDHTAGRTGTVQTGEAILKYKNSNAEALRYQAANLGTPPWHTYQCPDPCIQVGSGTHVVSGYKDN